MPGARSSSPCEEMPVDFDDRLWQGYREGRALPAQAMDAWMDAVERHADTRRPLAVLDLGSGTGRFTPSLADRFGGPVYGVEPATKMREIALASSTHANVTYLEGRAEQIPLPDGSCDLAFLFFVLHHFSDRDAAASELARVLRPARYRLRSNPVRRSPARRLVAALLPACARDRAVDVPDVRRDDHTVRAGGLRRCRARGGRVRGGIEHRRPPRAVALPRHLDTRAPNGGRDRSRVRGDGARSRCGHERRTGSRDRRARRLRA